MIKDLKEIVSSFDTEHIIKQIILIGMDGKIKNIEFNVEIKE